MGVVVIKGFKEFQKKLQAMPKKFSRKVLRQGLRTGAKVVLEGGKAESPVISGDLRDSLKVRAGKSRKRGTATISVITKDGFFKGDQFYGAFVIYGTKNITNPNNFLLRAFDSRVDQATQAISDEFRARIREFSK